MTATPPLFLAFAMAFSRLERLLTPGRMAALAMVTALSLCITFAPPWRHLVWSQVTIDPKTQLAQYQPGPWFWILVVYSYHLLLGGIACLYSGIFRFSSHYRGQFIPLLIAVCLPVTGNLIFILEMNPIPGFDWTAVGFIGCSLILIITLWRGDVFPIVPIARRAMIETISDGLVVVDDTTGRIVEVNPALATTLNRSVPDMLGRLAGEVFHGWESALEGLEASKDTILEQSLGENGDCRHFDLRVSLLPDSGGAIAGRLMVFRDITLRKELELEREALVEKLQKALEDVKMLSGLLPICAWCKKIRDDAGYWQSVENFLWAHSDVRFSHSICPECVQQMKRRERTVTSLPEDHLLEPHH